MSRVPLIRTKLTSVTTAIALAVMAILQAGCTLPWAGTRPESVHVAFTLENNLIVFDGWIDNRPARLLLGTATRRSVVDQEWLARHQLAAEPSLQLTLGARYSVMIDPYPADLGGIADAIVGADAIDGTLSLDFRRRLLVLSRDPIDPVDMSRQHFGDAPAVTILVDGRRVEAVLDTTIPDSLLLPATGWGPAGRRFEADLILGTRRITTDVAVADVSQPRLGNRLLAVPSLIVIDYRRREIGFW